MGFCPGSSRPDIGLTLLPTFLQEPCRKETPRASPAILEGRDPFSLGAGGLSAGGRHLRLRLVASPPSALGISPLAESRRYLGACLFRNLNTLGSMP